MTTNHPERLDPALIRPGRVDMHVEFKYASKHQIHEIFIRMYTPYGVNKPSKFDSNAVSLLADEFTQLVPADTFSPAELQQHLLLHRNRPQEAVDRVSDILERKQECQFQALDNARILNGIVPIGADGEVNDLHLEGSSRVPDQDRMDMEAFVQSAEERIPGGYEDMADSWHMRQWNALTPSETPITRSGDDDIQSQRGFEFELNQPGNSTADEKNGLKESKDCTGGLNGVHNGVTY